MSEPDDGPKPESAVPEPAPTPIADSAPILPPAYDEAALRDAVGVPPQPAPRAKTEPNPYGKVAEGDEDFEPAGIRSRRRTIMVSAAATLVGLTIAAAVFLGRANASRYMLVCTADHVSPEQGRAFPPWGSHSLSGSEWRQLALPPNAECKPRETDDADELARWYLDMLVDRASTTLTAHDLLEHIPGPGAAATATNPLDIASAELEQALLLARAPERRDQRKDIERLQGDVEYWRAAARARDAAAALVESAKQFEVAAAHRPRHVDDASAWATFARKVADELHAGPNGAPPALPAIPGEPRAPAPPGVALPVEPPPAGSDNNAAAAPPDAGVPTGGVLL